MRGLSTSVVWTTLLSAVLSVPANAALLSALGGEGVYDTDLDITYLADPMYIQSSGYDADGLVTASAAQSFIGYLNSSYYLGFNDWRLPVADATGAGCTDDTGGSTPSTDPIGFNCSAGEVVHLFYNELSGVAGSSLGTSLDPDVTLFDTIPDGVFWTSTENPGNSSELYTLGTINGFQNSTSKSFTLGRAWIVRSGGAETVVPAPAGVWLLLTGLIGAFGRSRIRHK